MPDVDREPGSEQSDPSGEDAALDGIVDPVEPQTASPRWSRRFKASVASAGVVAVVGAAAVVAVSFAAGDDSGTRPAWRTVAEAPSTPAATSPGSPSAASPTAVATSASSVLSYASIPQRRIRVTRASDLWYLDFQDIEQAGSAARVSSGDEFVVVAVAENSTYPSARYYVPDQYYGQGRPRGINVVDVEDVPESSSTHADGNDAGDRAAGGDISACDPTSASYFDCVAAGVPTCSTNCRTTVGDSGAANSSECSSLRQTYQELLRRLNLLRNTPDYTGDGPSAGLRAQIRDTEAEWRQVGRQLAAAC